MQTLPQNICKIIKACSFGSYASILSNNWTPERVSWTCEIGAETVEFTYVYNDKDFTVFCAFRNWSVSIDYKEHYDGLRIQLIHQKGTILKGELADIENDVVLLALAFL